MSENNALKQLVTYGINVKNDDPEEVAKQIYRAAKSKDRLEELYYAMARTYDLDDIVEITVDGFDGISNWSKDEQLDYIAHWMLAAYSDWGTNTEAQRALLVEEYFGGVLTG